MRSTMHFPAHIIVLSSCLVLCIAQDYPSLDICKLRKADDPCLPGGKWDPLAGKCTGYSGQACFACYTGPLCKTKVDNCTVASLGGMPVVFQEVWEAHNGTPCTTVPSDYRLAYQYRQSSTCCLSVIEQTIRKLHAEIGNVGNLDHYDVVVGLGATQVMAGVLYAHAQLHNAAHATSLPVYLQRPYYSHYPSQINATTVMGANSLPSLGMTFDPIPSYHRDINPNGIEVVTYPNNPNGEFRSPVQRNASRVVYDCTYLWPHFTDSYNQGLSENVMIFSASKLTGHAGSRVGWALIRRQAGSNTSSPLVGLTRSFIGGSTLGVSIEGQIRVYDALNAITGSPWEYFNASTAKMQSRWERVKKLFTSQAADNGFVLQNNCSAPVGPPSASINANMRCGAYAWVQCVGPQSQNCVTAFAAFGALGTPGTSFGADLSFVRFTLMMRSVEIDSLLANIERRLATPLATALPKGMVVPELRTETGYHAASQPFTWLVPATDSGMLGDEVPVQRSC